MTDKLKNVLKMFADFDELELDRISNCFKAKSVEKNSIILNEGSICTEFYFIQSGGIRTYFIDQNGHVKTRYIMLENHIGTALTSFIAQTPSFEFIEALDSTELLSISYSDFYELNKSCDNWKVFYQRILEMAYSFQNKKIEQLVTLTAKQRYQKVLEIQPNLIQRVSNKVLASYLDIREETLSRLKSE